MFCECKGISTGNRPQDPPVGELKRERIWPALSLQEKQSKPQIKNTCTPEKVQVFL